jgi:hypothetical protein
MFVWNSRSHSWNQENTLQIRFGRWVIKIFNPQYKSERNNFWNFWALKLKKLIIFYKNQQQLKWSWNYKIH